jgi:hypothetical protein
MHYKDNKLPYGINTCFDLFDKLKYEGDNLENSWNVYNSFNFIVTAWHLFDDWIDNDSENRPKLSTKKKGSRCTPSDMMQVIYLLRDITNSSKHFILMEKSIAKNVVTDVHPPIIGDAAAYFLHGPMIYVETADCIYSMWDIKYIVLLYFNWVFDDSITVTNFPSEIKEHVKRCSVKK